MFVQSIFDSIAAGVYTGDIGHSLRFRTNAYMSRTFGTPTDGKKLTLNTSVKPCSTATSHFLLARVTDSSNFEFIRIDVTTGIFTWFRYVANVLTVNVTSASAVFRDHTSHIKLHIELDTTQATAANRVVVKRNGEVISTTGTYPAQNSTTSLTAAGASLIGGYTSVIPTSDMYLSRHCLVEGSVVADSNFGYLNTEINEWVSKSQSAVKAVVDAGGTNSFMLDFDDATSLTTLGYDKSSKGNNWTLNSFSLTAGATYDHMLDVPGNSYATLNPLDKHASLPAPTNGNLTWANAASAWYFGRSTPAMYDGKWVAECTITGSNLMIGVLSQTAALSTASHTNAHGIYGFYWDGTTGYTQTNGTEVSVGAIASGTTIRMEYDYSAGTVALYNGASLLGTVSGVPTNVPVCWVWGVAQTTAEGNWCFGQAPLHSSATYRSAAGGYFRDAPSTGFKALCQANLPTPAILNPEQHHNVYTVTKSGNTNFTLDWDGSTYDTYFEIKRRNASGDWYNVDGLRGYDKILKSNSTAAETTDANVIGVSGTTCTLKSTLADGTYVISAWKAGLTASRQTNTDGSITSTVSRNVTSGFAIVTYTGTGANATVGHGVGAALKMVLAKCRNAARGWPVLHTSLGAVDSLTLNSTSAKVAQPAFWNSTAPTSTVFSLGTDPDTNWSASYTYVAYVHAEIPGYSKFGSYPGNGSADGPYVDLGFKAKWFRGKNATTGGAAYDWDVVDSVRNPYNPGSQLYDIAANLSRAEQVTGGTNMDLLALCLKIRSTDGVLNGNGNTHIYSAYADVAGKYALGR